LGISLHYDFLGRLIFYPFSSLPKMKVGDHALSLIRVWIFTENRKMTNTVNCLHTMSNCSLRYWTNKGNIWHQINAAKSVISDLSQY
jgi:hypothetical protein